MSVDELANTLADSSREFVVENRRRPQDISVSVTRVPFLQRLILYLHVYIRLFDDVFDKLVDIDAVTVPVVGCLTVSSVDLEECDVSVGDVSM